MKVLLLSHTQNPLQVMTSVKHVMQGSMLLPQYVTLSQAEDDFLDSLKTSIKSPFEFVSLIFHITDIPRSLTHQIVRHRHMSFVQESLRFSVKSGEKFRYHTPESVKSIPLYAKAISAMHKAYEDLIAQGVPTEDARGILPISTHTTIVVGCNYRSLWEMARQRLCHQSQREMRELVGEMKVLVGKIHPLLGEHLKPSCEHDLYCSWGGKMDRPCPLQNKYPIRIC